MAENKKETKKKTSRSKVKELEKELEQVRAELEEMKDKYLRLMAEFDNYKKRTAKEKLEMHRQAVEEVIGKLLSVFDDFDRAKELADDENSPETFSEGVELVYKKLQDVLKSLGVERIVPTGEAFNPDEHEAITRVAVDDEERKGKVIETVEKGYRVKDKIIRHPKVIVGH